MVDFPVFKCHISNMLPQTVAESPEVPHVLTVLQLWIMTYILRKLLFNIQSGRSEQQSRRVHCFFSRFRSLFSGKSVRTVQRP